MKSTGPMPPHFAAADDGMLLIGGQRADELIAEAGGTPLFVYDNNIVGCQITRFRAAMPYGIKLFYSVSANPYPELLQFIGRYVEGFRVVSGGEMERLRKAELSGITTTFAGPGKSDSELEMAIRAGVTISLESRGEAERAIRIAEQLGIRPKLAVRVDPPFEIREDGSERAVAPNPFGFDAEDAPGVIRDLIEADVEFGGINIFTGSQWLDADALIKVHRQTIELAGKIADAAGIRLCDLNLGGGFGTPCLAGELPLDVDKIARALNDSICSSSNSLATTCVSLDLGRWLVSEAGVYLTRVIEKKESGGRTFLVTDGGGHHLIGATGPFGEPPRRNYPVAIANKFGAAVEEAVTVTGCLCTPFDVLGDDVGLPDAQPGDIVAIFCAGAYGLTGSPQQWESRPPAREVMV
ncbi:MAG: pyridoxal-dependent decarboxylase, exosortase A system-associated [Sphingomicrobium sp.]